MLEAWEMTFSLVLRENQPGAWIFNLSGRNNSVLKISAFLTTWEIASFRMAFCDMNLHFYGNEKKPAPLEVANHGNEFSKAYDLIGTL